MLKGGIAPCLVGFMVLSLLSNVPWSQNVTADGEEYIPGYNVLVASYSRTMVNEEYVYSGWVREFSPDGSYEEILSDAENGPSDARHLANGNILVTFFVGTNPRVEEIEPDGDTVWEYSDGPSGHLISPYRAERLDGGHTLITDRGGNRVVEIDSDGETVWEMAEGLFWPMGASRLGNGNTLIADTYNERIIEVDEDCNVVWKSDESALAAERSPDGNTLIARAGDTKVAQVLEIDYDGNELWSRSSWGFETHTYDLEYLEDGNYLVSSQSMLYELNSDQETEWSLNAVGNVYSLQAVPSNDPPVASIAGGDRTAIVNEVLTFDGSGSGDSDGTVEYYEWDWGDSTAAGTTDTADHKWSAAGEYTVTLTVTDDDSATDEATVAVTVVEPAAAIDDTIGLVEDMGLPAKVEEALVGTLEDAVAKLDDGNWNGAEKKLDKFIEDVLAKNEKGKLTDDQAGQLVAMAEWIIDSVNAAIDASIAGTGDASALVDGMGLDSKTEKSLMGTLDDANAKLSDGKLDKTEKKLQSFIDDVKAGNAKGKISDAQAAELTAAAEAIIEGMP